MFRRIVALFRGFRWSLYFVHKHEGLRYALHYDDVVVLLSYVLARIEAGKRISPDWELHVNFNFEHKAIRVVEQYFFNGDISKEVLDQIATIDSGWRDPRTAGKPVFVDARTKKQLSLGTTELMFMSDAQRGKAIRASIEKRPRNDGDDEVTLDSVLSEVFYSHARIGEGCAMSSESDRAMQENMEYTLQLADKILLSSNNEPLDAFMKAVGTLAQVIHIITADEQREETLKSMMSMLRTYLKVLDAVRGPSSGTIR